MTAPEVEDGVAECPSCHEMVAVRRGFMAAHGPKHRCPGRGGLRTAVPPHCKECDDKMEVINFLEGEVIRWRERWHERFPYADLDALDGDDLPNCMVCGDAGVWPALKGICAECRETVGGVTKCLECGGTGQGTQIRRRSDGTTMLVPSYCPECNGAGKVTR
jgi:hypothetical protein